MSKSLMSHFVSKKETLIFKSPWNGTSFYFFISQEDHHLWSVLKGRDCLNCELYKFAFFLRFVTKLLTLPFFSGILKDDSLKLNLQYFLFKSVITLLNNLANHCYEVFNLICRCVYPKMFCWKLMENVFIFCHYFIFIFIDICYQP